MTEQIEVDINEVSVNDVLAQPILDANGQILLNENISLTEKHLSLLKNNGLKSIFIKVLKVYSPDEIKKIRKETQTRLKKCFKYFESGKKKDSLLKMFLIYEMRKYNG